MIDYYQKIVDQEALLIITQNSKVVFETTKSPVSRLMSYYNSKALENEEMIVYTSQCGIAIATFAKMMIVRKIYALKITKEALEILNSLGVEVDYSNITEAIISSANQDEFCQVYLTLKNLKTFEERVEYLKEVGSKNISCTIK